MPNKTVNSPRELVNRRAEIFPIFIRDWHEREAFDHKDRKYSYHSVFLTFGPESLRFLSNAAQKQIKEFCALVNYSVAKGGDLENEVSTCFLEQGPRLGVRKIIQSYLSREVRSQLQ
jgi:hypothetical protein